jgi:sterol desaturase/sphingolipid hydroxylase (fatty acid hydroxylase superfamily)
MFWLEPHNPIATPGRGSPRMFRVDWIEKYLSRVRPLHVVVVWVPVMLCFLVRTVCTRGVGLFGALALFLVGVLAWTFLEYVLHRWVFHFRPAPDSELQRDVAFLIHGVHHDWPYDPDRLVMPPLVAIVLAIAIGLPMRAATGPSVFHGLFAGLVGGYLWYDLTHYAVHHLRQHTSLGMLQRRNHLIHHFSQPDARYGVTTPLWDICFGTYPASTKAGAYGEPAAHPEIEVVEGGGRPADER